MQKSGTELALDQDSALQVAASSSASTLFPIGAYTIGYVHDLPTRSGTVTGLGARLTLNSRPASLAPFYWPGTPLGFELFARFRPTPLR